MKRLNFSDEERRRVFENIFKEEALLLRMSRIKMSIYQFESISIIGRGAFGEVRLCKDKYDGEIVAVKKMKKEDLHKKNQILHVKAEKEILCISKSEWIVKLKYSFQDDDYVYLVMEYLSGGDLMSVLIEKDNLTEEDSKLYAAELVLAIEDVHKLMFIHRDIKPDNILIDSNGHLKLSDFGLSKRADSCLYAENFVDLKNPYNDIPGITEIVSEYIDEYVNRKRKRIVSIYLYI